MKIIHYVTHNDFPNDNSSWKSDPKEMYSILCYEYMIWVSRKEQQSAVSSRRVGPAVDNDDGDGDDEGRVDETNQVVQRV